MRLPVLTLGAAIVLLGGADASLKPPKHQRGHVVVLGDNGEYQGCFNQNFEWYNIAKADCGKFKGQFTGWDGESHSMDVVLRNEDFARCGFKMDRATCAQDLTFGDALLSGTARRNGHIDFNDYFFASKKPKPGKKVDVYASKHGDPKAFFFFPTFEPVADAAED